MKYNNPDLREIEKQNCYSTNENTCVMENIEISTENLLRGINIFPKDTIETVLLKRASYKIDSDAVDNIKNFMTQAKECGLIPVSTSNHILFFFFLF